MGVEYAYEIEEALGVGIVSAVTSALPSFAMNIVIYVFTALALYTIANRRGLKNAWMAWVPVLDAWILGSISDQYRYVVKREVKSKRKILLTLGIISAVCGVVIAVLGIATVVGAVTGLMQSMSENQMMEKLVGPLIGMLGICVPLAGVSIAYTIIRYMALYDVFKSLDPQNCVMYLVLSIVFGITLPFFLFFNRNKDEGMPPRKQAAAQPVQEQPAYEQPVYEKPGYQQPIYEQPQDPPREPWNKDEPDYL